MFFRIKVGTIANMNPQDRLKAQKAALFQQLDAIESQQVLELMQDYLEELVAQEPLSASWTAHDQAAVEKGLADLDAGNVIAWEDFRLKFAQYGI